MIRAFSLALQFLTRIPVPVRSEPQPEDLGRSAFFFPVVGLLIGLILAGLYTLFPYADPGVLAIVLLGVWTLLTGGLHLDGLADTADAWIGGYGDRDRTLAIMKDPHSGPMAVTVIALMMLAKFASLKVVVEHAAWQVLVWIPVLGRSAMLLLLLTTRYIRTAGLGVAYARHLSRPACISLLLLIVFVTVLHFGWDGVALLSAFGIGFICLRRAFLARLGGITGDTLGATCELAEAFTLLFLVLWMG